jgi:hypothetical protein
MLTDTIHQLKIGFPYILQTYTPQPSTPIKHAGSEYSWVKSGNWRIEEEVGILGRKERMRRQERREADQGEEYDISKPIEVPTRIE